MPKGLRTALIAEGAVSQSWIGRLPGLRKNLGPVMSLLLRNASRFVNAIKCGVATDDFADFQRCELVLLAVPDAQLPIWVARILEHWDQFQNVGFVCCSSRQDSADLAGLKQRGAVVGSLSEMEGFDEKRYLFEGDRVVFHRLRKVIEEGGTARVVEIRPLRRAVYDAGLTFAAGMTFPMIAAAADSMKAAGLHPKMAESAVEAAVIGALRAYLRAGRRGWTGPIARSDRDELKRQYQALFDVDEALAEMYLKIAVDYLSGTAAKPKPDED
jgi:predicted short-subunit dehydrogenase-like oxidoreductase (DUF2520 family)